jgi:hypothetical protein
MPPMTPGPAAALPQGYHPPIPVAAQGRSHAEPFMTQMHAVALGHRPTRQ